MTEQEYIIVSHLARVRNALEILSDMTPDLDGVINQAEMYQVRGTIRAWIDDLHALVEIDHD